MDEVSARKGMPARLLRLLSLLQGGREWSGADLAARLCVTERTVRRDVDRLRSLDYRIEGTTGTAGGYLLGAGHRLPPLVLDDEEAVAVAVGLVSAAGSGVSGIADSSARALAKLERVLPARLRPMLAAAAGVAAAVPHPDAPSADPAVLAVLFGCCRDQEYVTFDYRARGGRDTARRVEPYRLVTMKAHWYLVAFDPDRSDWRTFRVDRIDAPSRTRHTFRPREVPGTDGANHLARSFATAEYRHTARMAVRADAETVRAGVFGPIPGDVEDDGVGGCTVRLSADTPALVVQYVLAVAALDVSFDLEAPREITDRLRHLAGRLREVLSPD